MTKEKKASRPFKAKDKQKDVPQESRHKRDFEGLLDLAAKGRKLKNGDN